MFPRSDSISFCVINSLVIFLSCFFYLIIAIFLILKINYFGILIDVQKSCKDYGDFFFSFLMLSLALLIRLDGLRKDSSPGILGLVIGMSA